MLHFRSPIQKRMILDQLLQGRKMTTTTSIILVCDESGAKGYADQREACPGEVGVFAGILVSDEIQSAAEAEFQTIYNRHKSANAKAHITDMKTIQQDNLRQDVYAVIRKLDLPCFWYAIHVEGLHNWHICEKDYLEDARNRAVKSTPEPRIRTGSLQCYPPSMHEELFVGLYAHLLAFLEEREVKKQVSIEVRTDQIDTPIVKNFEKLCTRLLACYPHVYKVPGWDMLTNQKVESTIQFKLEDSCNINVEIEVPKLTINPIHHGDGYTLAADVLANSLNHLFKNRDQSELYKPLNEPNSIKNHPIADNLAAFYSCSSGDIIGDRLYSHPKTR